MIFIRDLFVWAFRSKVRYINYDLHFINNKFSLSLLNVLPFFLIFIIFKLFNINYLYEKDNIIYYSEDKKTKLGPILKEIKINDESIFNKYVNYDNNVPLNLILNNLNYEVNDDDIIFIKYIKLGKMIENNLEYKKIKFKLKIELLFLK